MRSSVYYLGKDLERERRLAGENRIIKKFLEVGPWQFELETMARMLKSGAKIDSSNLSVFIKSRDWADEFNYINAGDMIFVIWIHKFGDVQSSMDMAPFIDAWTNRLKEFDACLGSQGFLEKKFGGIKFKIADLLYITRHRSSFPSAIPLNDYGRCIKLGGVYDIKPNFDDGGYATASSFVIYSAPMPKLDMDMEETPQDDISILLNADSDRVNLRPLPGTLLTDNNLGHWDLWWPEGSQAPEDYYEAAHLAKPMEARDPQCDIVSDPVAIDFGTSSTVVAIRCKGRTQLVRIGEDSRDENAETDAVFKNPFENPTVLRFEHGAKLLEIWRHEPYRPSVSWNDAQCSHQAREELKEHITQGMANLKTWVRKNPGDPPLVLTDGDGHEMRFAPPADLPGDDIEKDFAEAPLNPLELYAYYLGLNLNNQLVDGGRIFTEYYMTFPVMFEEDVKNRILASFRRGLIRSLPPSLIYACGFDVNKIQVRESANEPAAFAAAALPEVGRNEPGGAESSLEEEMTASTETIEPTEEGVAFGVFDFGGGTTDYAIGLYRLPTEQEELEEGWEKVVDILGASGDPDLGGENLVWHMAFEVARANREKLMREKVSFIKPHNAPHVSGAEKLFFQGGIAGGNTKKLMERLRPLWEQGKLDTGESGGQIELSFIRDDGTEAAAMGLDVNEDALTAMLKERIARAVDDFFALMGQSFKSRDMVPSALHVLLAGNSCRSPLVAQCFQEKAEAILAGGGEDSRDQIIIHPPLFATPENPEAVSLKTGVALGMLQSLGWEPIGIVIRKSDKKEAPFPYTVGALSHGLLSPRLRRDAPYDDWVEFGTATRTGSFLALYTRSPQGMEGVVKRGECAETRIDFGEGHMGRKIMVCASSPSSVKFAIRNEEGGMELEREVALE